MNKSELIDHIAAGTSIPRASAERVLNSMTYHIIGAVSANEVAQLIGLGSFSQTERSA